MSRSRGAALLLVLWLVALLTALVGAFALTARMEWLQGRVLGSGTQASEAARSGIEYALFRLADPDPATRWSPDGRAYQWSFAGAEVEIRVVDESGKVDLNLADPTLLANLMQAVGIERDQSTQLAAAIVDWRDADSFTQVGGGAEDPEYAAAGLSYGAKDALFESVAEVSQVLGMEPALYAMLEPHLTIYSGRILPDATYAQTPVLLAMGLDAAAVEAQRAASASGAGAAQVVGPGSGTYSVASRARLADGREAVLRSVMRMGGGAAPGSVHTALRWQEGTAPR